MILILAGSETTATLLSGCIYLLLSNPEKLEMLQREVRSAYKSDDDITLNNVNQLTYMLAVLNEALRLYPPVTSALVRIVPAGGENIADNFVSGGVSVIGCSVTSMLRASANHSYCSRCDRHLLSASHGPWAAAHKTGMPQESSVRRDFLTKTKRISWSLCKLSV